MNLKYASVKFCEVAVNVIVPLPSSPAALYSIICAVADNDTVFEVTPSAPVLDLLNDCDLVKLVNEVPFAVLPVIVYTITYSSVPSAAPLWSAIVQVFVPLPLTAPSVIFAVFPTLTANSPEPGVLVVNVSAVAPSNTLIVVPLSE